MPLYFLATAGLLFFLTGCSNPNPPKDEAVDYYSRHLYDGLKQLANNSRYDEQTSDVILAQSARSVSHSLQELAKIQRSVHHVKVIKEDPSLLKINVKGETSINWTGSVETVLQEIAKQYHLKLKVFGNKPPIPVIVSLNKQNTAVSDLIRDIAYLTQNQVSITYQNQSLELRYY